MVCSGVAFVGQLHSGGHSGFSQSHSGFSGSVFISTVVASAVVSAGAVVSCSTDSVTSGKIVGSGVVST